MARVSSLFERFKSLYRKQVAIDAELKVVEREILAIDRTRPAAASTSNIPRTATHKSKPKAPSAKGQLAPVTREMAIPTLTAIREAGGGEPVLRRVIAKQLGIGDYACTYRLQRLVALGFVERVGVTHYRVAKEVPEL